MIDHVRRVFKALRYEASARRSASTEKLRFWGKSEEEQVLLLDELVFPHS